MGYELRDYQRRASDAAVAYLTNAKLKGRHGIVIQPTGAGKSLVIADIVTRLPGRSVVLQPSREILSQNEAKLAAYGKRAAVFSASFNRKEIGAITLATVQSVVRYAEAFKDIDYVLIDEAHTMTSAKSGTMIEFLSVLEGVRILGLTATPFRLASNSLGSELRFLTRTRPRIFRDVVDVTQVGELTSAGYWTPLEYRAQTAVDRTKLTMNSTGADYTDASVQRYFAETGFVGKLYESVRQLLAEGRKHILVFTRFVDEAQRLAAALPCVGVVTAETPSAVRDEMLAAFRAGRLRVVANVAVLGIGFDFPALDTVVLGRPSVSLSTYYQQVGRAVRPHASKSSAVVVDLVGLTEMFGRLEDLSVEPGGFKGEQWVVKSGARQLTNIRFAERDGVDIATIKKTQRRRRYWAKRKNATTNGRLW